MDCRFLLVVTIGLLNTEQRYSRGAGVVRKREDMYGAFITPYTHLSLVRTESHTVNLGFVGASAEFPHAFSRGRVPYSNKCSAGRACRDEITRRWNGECGERTLMCNEH